MIMSLVIDSFLVNFVFWKVSIDLIWLIPSAGTHPWGGVAAAKGCPQDPQDQ